MKKLLSWIKSKFSPKKDAAVLDLSAMKRTELPPKPVAAPAFNPLTDVPTLKMIADDLLIEGKKWLHVREYGYNKGPDVELFQRFVDGKAQGESWCMAFVQYVTGQVCKKYGVKTPLYPTEHCNTLYSNTETKYRSTIWTRGFAFIMRNPNDGSGHTGICDNDSLAVEGNTSTAGSTDGDGVYFRYRSPKGSSTKPMRGYINLPLMIQDAVKKARGESTR